MLEGVLLERDPAENHRRTRVLIEGRSDLVEIERSDFLRMLLEDVGVDSECDLWVGVTEPVRELREGSSSRDLMRSEAVPERMKARSRVQFCFPENLVPPPPPQVPRADHRSSF